MKHLSETYPATCQTTLDMGARGQTCARQSMESVLPIYAHFIWLIRWMIGWAVGDEQQVPEIPVYQRRHVWVHTGKSPSRKARRRRARPVPPAHDFRPFLVMLGGTRSKAQFLEKMTRISVIGRINLYGFRYWHKVRLSMTKLTPFDVGGWSAPMSAIHADGLWDVQALPG